MARSDEVEAIRLVSPLVDHCTFMEGSCLQIKVYLDKADSTHGFEE